MNNIGIVTWDACLNCEHYPPEDGGCRVAEESDSDWQRKIMIDGDSIFCHSFKKLDSQPTSTKGSQ